MQFIKVGQRIVNLQNVKFIELIENSRGREIRFYFIDGSYCYCNLEANVEDREFEYAWHHLNNLKVLS